MKALISVIVPVYNVEKYLDQCVESIATQSYTNLEIILVDDGSTDCSGMICDKWSNKDARIQVLHKKNGGLSDARNAGIEIATGIYYMFIDSDDTIAVDTIQLMYEAIVSDNCEIAVCNMVRTYENDEQEPFYAPVHAKTVLADNKRFETLRQPSVCNKMFRASLFKEVRFPKGRYYEDTFIYHILAYHANRIVLTGHDGYYYRSRRESILGQPQYTERYFDFIEAVYNRAVFLTEHKVPFYAEEACLSLYAAASNGERYLDRAKCSKEKFRLMRQQYNFAYTRLIRNPNVGLTQKIRLVLLCYLPALHNLLYH